MDLSIVIPTFNECDNVRTITAKIVDVLAGCGDSYEILFVDDSRDDTPALLAAMAEKYPFVKFIHRTDERGLASAVVKGFSLSTGKYIVVMDADLQHPPELLPIILKRLARAEVVIPSRFIDGGSDGGLNLFRKLVSWTARMIGRLSIKRLRAISDCTSGYFGLHRSVIATANLDPVGWKILMEVLVKGDYHTVHEVPYTFAARDSGSSKMTWKDQYDYLRHITRLARQNPEDARFFTFCLVGAAGVPVNLLGLTAFLNLFGVGVAFASAAASFLAMVHNFLWNDSITWRVQRRPKRWRRWLQFLQFALVSTLGIVITAAFAHTFYINGWSPVAGQLVGILLATWWSFVANDRWTWGRAEAPPELVVTRECTGDTM
jgi:Glycosyltransferases involved in cell wall biogenesis